MALDHSLTYKEHKIKNVPHKQRLNTIISVLESEVDFVDKTYADVGCSNGYVTALINDKFKPLEASGYDDDRDNLEIAKQTYPHINFKYIDLNTHGSFDGYDIVTCFETLEHVGNLQNGVQNLLDLAGSSKGVLFISVPIEIGVIGLIKFLVKTIFYGYDLKELPPSRNSYSKYFIALLTGGKLSIFRDHRTSWGTHFGFDYRDIDDFFLSHNVPYRAFNKFTTRFYIVRFE